MKPGNERNTEMNRRDFLTIIGVMAGCATMESSSLVSSAKGPIEYDPSVKRRARVGISDKAYEQAWKRAKAMVDRMTLDEKIAQTGSGAPPIERLNIPGCRLFGGVSPLQSFLLRS